MRQAEVIVPDERQTIVSRMQARMLVQALRGLVCGCCGGCSVPKTK